MRTQQQIETRRRGYKRKRNRLKAMHKQLREIKYSLISKRDETKGLEDGLNKEEYNKLYRYMRATAKKLQGLPDTAPNLILPKLFEPTLKLKTRTFILENCPGYAKRMIKNNP